MVCSPTAKIRMRESEDLAITLLMKGGWCQPLEAIYVTLDTREIVALQPRNNFKPQMLIMAKKVGVTVLEDSRKVA